MKEGRNKAAGGLGAVKELKKLSKRAEKTTQAISN
jgi:hypothetical protein